MFKLTTNVLKSVARELSSNIIHTKPMLDSKHFRNIHTDNEETAQET